MSKDKDKDSNGETAIGPQLPAPVARRGLDEFTWRALVNSVFPGATSESILMAVDYCKARGLDVLKRPVHIVPMSVKNVKTGQYEWRDIIMPGISELRTTAARTGQYAGQDEPIFGQEVLYKDVNGPETCTVTVYRFTRDQRVPFTHTERFREAVVTKKDGSINSMWSKRPYGQLAKCTEAGALRKAFPEEIGNEHTAEEMAGRELETPLVHVEEVERRTPQRKPKQIEAEPEAVESSAESGEPETVESAKGKKKTEPAKSQNAEPSDPEKVRVHIQELIEGVAQKGYTGNIFDLVDQESGARKVKDISEEKLGAVEARLEAELKKL